MTPNFSYLLLDVARAKGFKAIVVPWGNSVMTLAREYQPDAITLDLHLPDMDGWSVLARLKEDAATRHIPVHIISVDEEKDRGLAPRRAVLHQQARHQGVPGQRLRLHARVHQEGRAQPAGGRGQRRPARRHPGADRGPGRGGGRGGHRGRSPGAAARPSISIAWSWTSGCRIWTASP